MAPANSETTSRRKEVRYTFLSAWGVSENSKKCFFIFFWFFLSGVGVVLEVLRSSTWPLILLVLLFVFASPWGFTGHRSTAGCPGLYHWNVILQQGWGTGCTRNHWSQSLRAKAVNVTDLWSVPCCNFWPSSILAFVFLYGPMALMLVIYHHKWCICVSKRRILLEVLCLGQGWVHGCVSDLVLYSLVWHAGNHSWKVQQDTSQLVN